MVCLLRGEVLLYSQKYEKAVYKHIRAWPNCKTLVQRILILKKDFDFSTKKYVSCYLNTFLKVVISYVLNIKIRFKVHIYIYI